MDTITILQPEMTVDDLLKTWPSAYSVFLNGKSECIGCSLQKFCTLREVAGVYQVPLGAFMEELERYVQTISHFQRS